MTAVAETCRLADVFGKAVSIYSRRFVPFITLTVIASIPDYIALWAIGIARLNLASGLAWTWRISRLCRLPAVQ